jgi:hypothetical protein
MSEGAFLGGRIALVLGQAGPQAGVPEEIITVPLLTLLGAAIGYLIKVKD